MRSQAPHILIVGGGLGGIALGVKLRKAGFESFEIIESEAGPGGTWWINDYPGAEVDIHSSIYSYSFMSRNWSRTHASRDEILEYITDTVTHFGLWEKFRFSTRVIGVVWHEDRQQYEVTLDSGRVVWASIVVSAVGTLSNPKLPDWPGLESFAGTVMHTTAWDHTIDLTGLRVGVVGVGSTATQIIPSIAPTVAQLTVFQREPGWVLPKNAKDFDQDELAKYSSATRRRLRRLRMLARTEWGHTSQPVQRIGSKRAVRAEAVARAYINRVFADRPDLNEKVTPRYVFSAKRRVLSDDYYPALLRDNVELVTSAVASVTEHGVVTADGREVELDVLVAGTGFHASKYLASLPVTGRDGTLDDLWKDSPYAFLGITVPGFPNFYMLYGPNTNGGGPITTMHERQADFIVADVKRMMRRGYASIEVRPEVALRYRDWIDRRLAGTAWASGNNYFKAPDGRIVTQWTGSAVLYAWLAITRRVSSSVGHRAAKTPARQPAGGGDRASAR